MPKKKLNLKVTKSKEPMFVIPGHSLNQLLMTFIYMTFKNDDSTLTVATINPFDNDCFRKVLEAMAAAHIHDVPIEAIATAMHILYDMENGDDKFRI